MKCFWRDFSWDESQLLLRENDLVMTYLLEDAVNSRVGVLEGRSKKLQQASVFQFQRIVYPLHTVSPSAAHLR